MLQLEPTQHLLDRFVERTGVTCNTSFITLVIEADLVTAFGIIPWEPEAHGLLTLLGVYLVRNGRIVTFLSWDDLPRRRRQALKNISVPVPFVRCLRIRVSRVAVAA